LKAKLDDGNNDATSVLTVLRCKSETLMRKEKINVSNVTTIRQVVCEAQGELSENS